jgi:hypothetical protein
LVRKKSKSGAEWTEGKQSWSERKASLEQSREQKARLVRKGSKSGAEWRSRRQSWSEREAPLEQSGPEGKRLKPEGNDERRKSGTTQQRVPWERGTVRRGEAMKRSN